nr:PREDICTED: uncharacterized protein LOC109039535 [Bemisia tabaci]
MSRSHQNKTEKWALGPDQLSVSPIALAALNGNVKRVRSLIQSGAELNRKESTMEATPIFSAIIGEHEEIIKIMVQAGADLNVKGDKFMTPLALAVSSGKVNLVKCVLDLGAKIKTRVYDYNSVLHVAAECGCADVAKFLIERGLDVDIENVAEETPLHLAVKRGETKVVKTLIACGANVNASACTVEKVENEECGLGTNVTPVFLASAYGHLDVVDVLIKAGADVNAKTSGNHVCLHPAAQEGPLELVNMLLKAGADPNVKTFIGRSPLFFAARSGDAKIVEALLNAKGIDPNPKANCEETPLIMAAGNGFLSIVKMLIAKGAPINGVSYCNMTPLHVAILKGQEETAEWLLRNGAYVSAPSVGGISPIHFACTKGVSVNLLRTLIAKGANINDKSVEGATPLHLAAQHDHIELVKFLLDKGANPNATCSSSLSVLHHAVKGGSVKTVELLLTETDADLSNELLLIAVLKGHQQVARILLKHGADVNSAEMTTGKTPLHIAVEKGNQGLAELLLKYRPHLDVLDKEKGSTPLILAVKNKLLTTVKVLVERGANVNAPGRGNVFPINIAISQGLVDIVKVLFNRGAYFEIPSNGKNSNTGPLINVARKVGNSKLITILESVAKLFTAVEKSNIHEIKCCIEAGSIVNARDSSGRTVLHFAVSNKNLEIVNMLLAQGADLTLATNKGNLPLHLAVAASDISIIKTLLLHARKLDLTKYNFVVNAATSEKKATALHVAAEKDNFDIVKLLIENGAVFNAKNKAGKTPVRLSSSKEMTNYFDSIESLFKALKEGDGPEEVANILVSQRSVMNARHVDGGWTLLYWAISEGHSDLANVLVNNGADYFLVTNKGTSPLHIAASKGDCKAVKALLNRAKSDNPAKVEDLLDAFTVNGSTALHVAANVDVVRCLLQEGAIYNIRNGANKTAQELTKNDEIRKLLRITAHLFETIKKSESTVMSSLSDLTKEDFQAVTGARNEEGKTLRQIGLASADVKFASKLKKKLKIQKVDGKQDQSTQSNNFSPISETSLLLLDQIMEIHFNLIKALGGEKALLESSALESPLTISILKGSYLGLRAKMMFSTAVCSSVLLVQGSCQRLKGEFAVWGFYKGISYLKHRTSPIFKMPRSKETKSKLTDSDIKEFKDFVKDLPFHKSLIMSTPLHTAAMTGNVQKVRSLIKSGADINFKEPPYFVSPIFSAVQGKNKQVVDMMIKAGAELNVEADDHMTPLGCAVLDGDLNITKLLVDNGARLHTRIYDNLSILHVAVARGHVEIVKYLIEKGIDVNAQTEDEETALHLAIKTKNKEIVKLLLDGEADTNIMANNVIEEGTDIDEETGGGPKITTLWLALFLQLPDYIIDLLIEKGANIHARTSGGLTVLHLAALLGFVREVNLFLQAGCDVNVKSHRKNTPLHFAANAGHVKVVETLLKVEGIEVNPKSNIGETPLAKAAGHGSLEIVKALVAKGAPINGVSYEKMTPLHAACVTGQYQVVEWLIKNKANVHAKASMGMTPLHFTCVEKTPVNVIGALIANGADINATCDNGMTPIHFAASCDKLDSLKYLVKKGGNLRARCFMGQSVLDYAARGDDGVKTLKYLISETGVIWDCDLCSPLYQAVKRGRLDMVELIMNNGGVVNGCVAATETPLHIAAERGDADMVKLLLKYEPIINMRNTENGCTPLLLAVKKEHNTIVKMLLEKNADVNVPSTSGLYPIHVAVRSKNEDVVNALLTRGSYYNIEAQGEKNYDYPLKMAHKLGNSKLITMLELVKKIFDAVIENDVYQVECCIQAGAILNAKNASGTTILHYAVNNKNLKIVNSLLSRGVDFTQATNKGNLPLHLAVSLGDMKIIKTLLTNARKQNLIKYNLMVNATTKEGLSTPLHVAAEKGNFDVVKLLIKSGAIFNRKNKDDDTPLEVAKDEKIIEYLRSVETLFEDVSNEAEDLGEEAASILASERSVMNARHASGGWTLMYWAISKDQTDLAKVLINYGADYFLVTNKGTSPLHIAASKGNLEVMKALLNRVKSDCPDKLIDYINGRTVKGSSAMHVAASIGAVRWLMQRGGTYNIRNDKDKTPQDVAKDDKIRDLLQTTHDLFESVKKGSATVRNTLNNLDEEDFKAVAGTRNIEGQTLLQIATKNGSGRLAGKLLEKLKKLS